VQLCAVSRPKSGNKCTLARGQRHPRSPHELPARLTPARVQLCADPRPKSGNKCTLAHDRRHPPTPDELPARLTPARVQPASRAYSQRAAGPAHARQSAVVHRSAPGIGRQVHSRVRPAPPEHSRRAAGRAHARQSAVVRRSAPEVGRQLHSRARQSSAGRRLAPVRRLVGLEAGVVLGARAARLLRLRRRVAAGRRLGRDPAPFRTRLRRLARRPDSRRHDYCWMTMIGSVTGLVSTPRVSITRRATASGSLNSSKACTRR